MLASAFLLGALSFLSTSSLAASYSLVQNYDASNFLNGSFQFENISDSSYVTYVSQQFATQNGLAKTVDGKVYLGVDNSTHAASPGRNSVRVKSQASFNRGLIVGDFAHVPGNTCGTWPAFWALQDAEDYSEIDIIEYISQDKTNVVSMYTNQQCALADGSQTGTDPRSSECYYVPSTGAGNPHGCGITGGIVADAMNNADGGVYALQVEDTGVRVWFFSRSSVPADLNTGSPNPDTWPTPVMDLTASSCSVTKAFTNMQIVLNIALCGSYAGGASWAGAQSNCAAQTGVSTCDAYVQAHPEAFDDAYWLINSVKVFE